MLGQSVTPPLFSAVFHQPGALGIQWECLLYRDGDQHVTMSYMDGPMLRDQSVMQFAIIKQVQPVGFWIDFTMCFSIVSDSIVDYSELIRSGFGRG